MRKSFARHLAPLRTASRQLCGSLPIRKSLIGTRCDPEQVLRPGVLVPSSERLLHHSLIPRQDVSAEVSAPATNASAAWNKFAEAGLFHIIACPGCGALAQSVESGRPGYYTMKRNSVVDFLTTKFQANGSRLEEASSQPQSHDQTNTQRENEQNVTVEEQITSTVPVCDRCHDLKHHNVRVSVETPTIDSISDILDSSPWRHNHIIHVIDAADFPLSAIRGIHELLNASPQRSRNRRAKTRRFMHNRITDLTFVITRSDLLAPKKEMVDGLMPVLIRILQKHLGLDRQRKRFGNVRCVSSTRGWWTPEVKAALRAKGGAIWLVGKENVGKSALFEVIFPKGTLKESPAVDGMPAAGDAQRLGNSAPPSMPEPASTQSYTSNEDFLDPDNLLLPPARPEVPYPLMPTVSEMPGTTASPIRIPFGSGMGEMIDLPGLERGDVQALVQTPHQAKLLMRKRVSNPTRYKIKPGQSLLLGGGLVRLTPLYQNSVTIMTPFVTVDGHQTSNEKAVEIQGGSGDVQVPSILTEVAKQNIASAGVFEVSQDATKERAGPLTARNAVGLRVEQLPFRVFATDIVIEGLGWVDVAVEVRTREFPHGEDEVTVPFPAVEVFTPYGKYVAGRETLNAGHYMGPKKTTRRGGPRKSVARGQKS